jgi:hypothetical protein
MAPSASIINTTLSIMTLIILMLSITTVRS